MRLSCRRPASGDSSISAIGRRSVLNLVWGPGRQERLARRPDGKILYRLRRPWPNAQGATHLVLEPLDFLRRLAALVSFPYAHQIRHHGVFANHSRWRRLLPPPPPSLLTNPRRSRLPELDVDSPGQSYS